MSRLHVTVHLEGETLGLGGPEMTVIAPDEFFARIGRDGLIGFGEAYLTGAWDADDLAGFLTVLAAEHRHAGPRSRCSGSAACTSRGDRAPYARTRPTPATTSRTTTTCPTTCSGSSSTRP